MRIRVEFSHAVNLCELGISDDRRDLSALIESVWFEHEVGWHPGHYYSPIPDAADIQRRRRAIFREEPPAELPEIDLDLATQLSYIQSLHAYADVDLPMKFDGVHRYYSENDFYSYMDALILAATMRKARPRRIVEIGSGFSSAIMLDVSEADFSSDIQFTFIEPNAERLNELLKPADRHLVTIFESLVQDVDADIFRILGPNDILFIDSSHVSKVGSDVNYIFFDVLPVLRPGVLIHFHDIFYPFEYPAAWVLEQGRYWNENYMMRAFLANNSRYLVRLFAHYVGEVRPQALFELAGRTVHPGCSLWIEKTAPRQQQDSAIG
ncbi:MAG: class I SAM-dependent methyltransferase [Candidatus Eremiobacteraeota bacterium]|nr:class I SAM-dependent methyltransferase [Candidatus Eremiobacteraeota bacterium]